MRNNIKWIRTHCSRMDHGGCAVLAGVKDNKIVKIKGDPYGFLNKGYICIKGLKSYERLSHPDRLKYPLKRVGNRGEGRWKRITWSEAIDIISTNLLKIKDIHGAKAVAFCQGMPKGMEHFGLIRLANIFGSPNVVGTQDVCHAPRELTGVLTCGFYPAPDLHKKTGLVMLWGSNITSTNEEGVICSLLLNRIREGAKLIVIDPRKTALAGKAKYWLQLRPGTDNALALTFLNVVIQEGLYDKTFVDKYCHGFKPFSEHIRQYSPEKMANVTWVPASLIRDAARYYAKISPAAIQWGNAIEQNVNTFDTSRALICLMAICGNLDIPGGNVKANEPDILRLGRIVRADLLPFKRDEMIHAYYNTISRLMTVPPTLFRKAVLEEFPYPVKGAFMQGTNPLLVYAESGMTLKALMKLDFLTVCDIFMTPTSSFADIVLPAATSYEFNDIGHAGIGHGYIIARPKVVEPPGECWPDIKIINELGKKITSGEYWYNDYNDLYEEILKPAGVNYKQFAELGYLKGDDQYKKHEKSGFKTATGKVELILSHTDISGLSAMPAFKNLPEEEDPDYPLVLTSRKSRFYLHSSYRWMESLRGHCPEPRTDIHPETAKEYGINEGDEVIIKTRMGEITQVAHLTDCVHPKVIYSAYGWWFPEGDAGSQYNWKRSNFNILTSAEKSGREFGTPNLKGIGCVIRRKE